MSRPTPQPAVENSHALQATPYVAPYFAYQRDDSNPHNTVIIATDLTLTPDLMPAGKDLTVYADQLTLTAAPLKLPGQNVTISARRIVSQGGSINISPAPPPPPLARAQDGTTATQDGQSGTDGTDGLRGIDGQGATHITISAAVVEGNLTLLANGAPGQQGQQGGNAGDGHAGAAGAEAVIDRGSMVSQAQQGQQGGSGGCGGSAGTSGSGGHGGAIYVGLITAAAGISASALGGAAGPDAAPGGFGRHAAGGIGGRLQEYRSWGSTYGGGGAWTYVMNGDQFVRAPNGPDGVDGFVGNTISNRPNPTHAFPTAATKGQDRSAVYAVLTLADFLPTQAPTLNLLTQRTLTLRQAELSYLNSDYQGAYTLLNWIANVTPAAGSSKLPPDHVAEWTQLHDRAVTLLAYLQQGLDYYGEPRNHVPLAALKFYVEQTTNLIAIGKIIEDQYDVYSNQSLDQSQRLDALKSVASKMDACIASLSSDLTRVQDDQTKAQSTIATLSRAQNTQQAVLAAAQEAYRLAVVRSAPSCSFGDIIRALVTVVTMAEGAYQNVMTIGGVVGSFGDKTSGVLDTIKKLVTAGKSLGDLQQKWQTIENINTGEHPDQAKIAIQKADFAAHVATFDKNIDDVIHGSSDSDVVAAAKNFKKQAHIYLDIIQARNQKVYEYTSLVVKGLRLRAVIAQKQSEADRINSQLAGTIDPTLPSLRTFMEGAYQDVRADIIRFLVHENGAFNYWALQNNPISLATQRIGQLATTHATILGNLETHLNGAKGPRQQFGNDTTARITVRLPRADFGGQFDDFVTGHLNSRGHRVHSLGFAIPVDTGIFGTWYQVIATNFTIAVKGARSDAGTLDINLIHSGRAQFVDENGNALEYSHNSTLQDYTYDLSSGARIGGGALGGDANNPYFIGVSPLTAWMLVITDRNGGIDLSKVTEIDLTFGGLYYPGTS